MLPAVLNLSLGQRWGAVRGAVRCDPKIQDFSGAGAVRVAWRCGVRAGVNFGRTKYLEFLANTYA